MSPSLPAFFAEAAIDSAAQEERLRTHADAAGMSDELAAYLAAHAEVARLSRDIEWAWGGIAVCSLILGVCAGVWSAL